MSKKIAAGTPVILLDVKVGDGAFMETIEKARRLAGVMVAIGTQIGRKVYAELTDMNQPLGAAVGNILEVKESIAFLKGEPVPSDLYEHCVKSSATLLEMAGAAGTSEDALAQVRRALSSGAAFESLKKLVSLQGEFPEGIVHIIFQHDYQVGSSCGAQLGDESSKESFD